jgi:hypothetical protein
MPSKTKYIYTRHKTCRYVQDFLECTSGDFKVFAEYDFGFKDQYSYAKSFQKVLRSPCLINDTNFKLVEIDDIILRCRLLRSFRYDEAYHIVLAAERICIEFIEKCFPEAVVAPRIDTFFLDVLERVLSRYSIPYIGVWRSAFLSDKFFLTNRGEHRPISEANSKEVDQLIESVGSCDFRATSIGDLGFSRLTLVKKHVERVARDFSLEIVRVLGGYNYGYRELATGFHTDDYNVPITSWFGNFLSASDTDKILCDPRPKVFIALQVNPEATIDYYSDNVEFVDINVSLFKVVKIFLQLGYIVIIKDHPNMFGRRDFRLLNNICSAENVFLVKYQYSSNVIIRACQLVFTWSGTVAIQSFFFGIPSISVCSPFRVALPGFSVVRTYDELFSAVSHAKDGLLNTSVDHGHKVTLAQQILRSHASGSVFTHDRNTPNASGFAFWLDRNIETIVNDSEYNEKSKKIYVNPCCRVMR